ncbi:hypothetical protein F53441_2319 [Fusarium austroafricanum]|uniref:Uncharacterized protein n=1 Tax=Fusarium austroafricanum TaxID=2364996 RepID=A0A8H4KPZ0_9HYPO|nr:hypothetical protein F53441_2319 [Fusarium austroafricanum]
MPLIPTAVLAAVCLLRDITNPLQKIHSAANLRDADNSSSVIRHRSAPWISPIELESLPPRPKPPSPSSPDLSRPTLESTDSATSTSSSYSVFPLSPQQRDKLSEQIWKGCWQEKIKRGVWAVAFAACIFAGTITGAQLKTDNEKKEAIQEFRATSPNEQIAALLSQRKSLVSQKAVLQRKMDAFELRVKEREAEKARKEDSS